MLRSKYKAFNYLEGILAFLVVFVAVTTLNFSDSIKGDTQAANQSSQLLTSNFSLSSDFYSGHFRHKRNPFNLPNSPYSSPFEKEVEIEKDFADEDEWHKPHTNASFWLYKEINLTSSIHTTERSLAHPGKHQETHLFVLYCAWKEYLS